ncbi:MAG: hypothetical protein AB1Z98_26215 [Nannocystaceae bacterium]
MADVLQLPPSESHRLVPIESFKIVPGIVNDTWILIVEGSAPCANMVVTLEPAVYIRQPEYWRIEAVGTLPGGICLTAIKPYSATLPLAGAMGTRGIELVGKRFSERIEVPPQAEPEAERVLQVGAVSLAVLESMPRQLQIDATGTASTPGWSDPRLVMRDFGGELPPDGIVHLDFVAEPPEGIVPQVLAPIAATYRWPQFETYAKQLRGVRVHAKTNAVDAPYAEGPVPGPGHQEQVDLPLGKEVPVDGGALTLKLVDVADSRCPSNVVCVWQGFVVATVEVGPGSAGAPPRPIELSSLADGPVELPSGHRLRLVSVMPYPVAGAPAPREPVATVFVSRP